jgi:hypothetical protein
MKSREPRVRCVITARMRFNGSWSDVCVHNISSRGMLIQAGAAAARGSYIEVRRGQHVIVGRVAWSKGHRLGVRTQERLDIGAILREPDASKVNYEARIRSQPSFDRRSVYRLAKAEAGWKAEQSRFRSRALEFACVAAMSAFAALMIFDTATESLRQPLNVVADGLTK